MKSIFIFLFILITFNSYGDSIDNFKKLDVINYEWWSNFSDPFLSNYILYGLENSSDLKIIDSKIREYKEFTKYTFGSELPTVSTSLMYINTKDIPFANNKFDVNGFVLPLSVNYELDLFAKNRDKTKSTKKQLESYILQKDSIYISYVSNIGTLYFNIVKLNKVIELYNKLKNIDTELLFDAEEKFNNNLLSENNLSVYKQNLSKTENSISELMKNRDLLLTQLSVLIGKSPIEIDKLKFMDLYNIKLDFNTEQEFLSDVIFNRPDVLSCEKELEKSNIDIKIARKEFLPTFNISGSVLFNDFVGGRKKANLKMMNERYIQMLEKYKKASLQAVKEVNDSLNNILYDYDINKKYSENYIMELKKFETNKIKYNNNLISKLDLMIFEKQLIKFEIDFVLSKFQLFIDYIGLYKSVGAKL